MKDKILTALKNKYKTLGFGDKAFEGVADYLSTQITEEGQIETAAGGVEGLLKAFQGDIDKVRGEKSNLQKEFDELKAKQAETTKPVEPPKDDLDAKIAAAIEAANKPLLDKLQGYEAKEKQSEREGLIKRKATELGIPEWRIKEGFPLKEDASEDDISNALSAVKQNIVAAGLGGRQGFPLNTDEKPTDEQTDAILSKIGY